MKTLLIKSVAVALLSCLCATGANAYEDLTHEWRTSVDYRNGKPDVRIMRQGKNAQGQRSSIEVNKSSDRYNLRYNNGLDIRLQSRGSDFKDLRFDFRSK